VRISSKSAFKKHAGKCAFCLEDNYSTLDAHRIFEGQKGGKYYWQNCICVCANCHRKIHDGQIIVIKKHLGFGENLYVLEYIENGENKLLGLHY
jgi:hypothetical protein